jgi:hypothetical protein
LWRPNICAPVFWARPDATFTNDSALETTGMVFHAVIEFTPKWPGAFTCDVVVMPTLEPLTDKAPLRWPDDIASLPVGSYRIGWFVARRDIWWRLVDDAAESRRLWESIPGVDAAALTLQRNPDHWYAPSYAVELPAIVRQASEHFSDTFESHVLPKLQRNA